MNWLGPYVINLITDGGAVQLQQCDGSMFTKLVNGICLKPYQEGLVPRDV